VFGIVWNLMAKGEGTGRRRTILGSLALIFLIMEASTLSGGIGGHIYRATVPLTTASIPFMLAPFLLSADFFGNSRLRPWFSFKTEGLLRASLLVAASSAYLLFNYQQTIARQRMANTVQSDSIALGALLRQETIRPQLLADVDMSRPVRLWLTDMPAGPRLEALLSITYTAGYIDRMDIDPGAPAAEIDSLTRNQALVAMGELHDARLAHVCSVGRFRIYRRIPEISLP
jgi:hypothetical protein